MMQSNLGIAVWLAALALTPSAWAAHPLVTEDTGTQGVGNAELEHGASWSRDGDARAFAFQPQLSFGLLPELDVIVQPSWLSTRNGPDRTNGFGDTALDVKWRFYGDAPLSLALRTGLLLPTAQQDLGLPHGKVSAHALLVATVDALPWTLHGNLGYTRNPASPELRSDLAHASAAAMFAVDDRWTLALDAGIDQNPDPAQSAWLKSLLAGAIYTVRPGFDVDIGYQAGLQRDQPVRQWLLGVTYRWAP
jgi:hypothetical protein